MTAPGCTSRSHSRTTLGTRKNVTYHCFHDLCRGGDGATLFKQRLCIYNKYVVANTSYPVFFYTGNESPVEEYVNNSGFMWSLAKKYNALVVFAGENLSYETINIA